MAAVRVELDNLPSPEIDCDNDIKSNFIVANASEANDDCCEGEDTSSSPRLSGKSRFVFSRSGLVTALI